MKILQAIPYFNPKKGGDVNVCYNLSKQLAKRGHDVTIITTDFEFDEEYTKSLKDVEVLPFKNTASLGSFFYSPEMKKWVKTNIKYFDVIHTHTFRSYQNNVIHKYAKKYGVPYVLQAHGSVPRIVEKQRLKMLYDWFWGNKILRDASKVIAVSNVEMEHYKKESVDRNKIEIVPNGLDYKQFENLPRYGSFKRKYDIKESYIILYLGRIHKRKGIDFLIKSFKPLSREIDDVILVIAGADDGYKEKLERIIRDLKLERKVKILGYIDNSLEAYRDANILVYPALHEIFGLVPLEAVLSGTPVIVTDDCGCGELIKESSSGYLVRFGDINDLKRKMEVILESPELSDKLIQSGKEYIKNNLTWSKTSRRLEKVYGEIREEKQK